MELGENGVRVGAAWSQGRRPTMEDSHLLLPDLREELEAEEGRVALFAVFDGHGGQVRANSGFESSSSSSAPLSSRPTWLGSSCYRRSARGRRGAGTTRRRCSRAWPSWTRASARTWSRAATARARARWWRCCGSRSCWWRTAATAGPCWRGRGPAGSWARCCSSPATTSPSVPTKRPASRRPAALSRCRRSRIWRRCTARRRRSWPRCSAWWRPRARAWPPSAARSRLPASWAPSPCRARSETRASR